MNVAAVRRPVPGLLVGYLLAFALPWLVWGSLVAEQRGLLSWHVPQSLAFWIGLPVAYLCGAVASGGKAAVVDLFSRLIRVRVGWLPYLAAIGLALGLPLVVWIGTLLVGGAAGAQPAPLGTVPGALLVEIALFWLTEEPMWRGFVLPRVELWLGPGPAAVVVGLLWAVWHLPLFAIVGSFQSSLPFFGFALLTVATSVILSWLYHRSAGSVVVCALFHGIVDVTFATTGVLSASPAAFWAVVVLHLAVAAALWWRGGLREPAPSA